MKKLRYVSATRNFRTKFMSSSIPRFGLGLGILVIFYC